jgi:hypothetical protein
VKKREERTGPPAVPAFRHGLSNPDASPAESHPAHLRPIEDEPRLRYVYAETFAYGPARGADRRWGSSLVAGALSATLVASIIALAVVGFGRPVGVPPLSSPRLQSETEGDPVEVAAPSTEEQAGGTSPAAGPASGEATAPLPAVAGEADGSAPPGPQAPPSPVQVADEPAGGLQDQGAGQGATGGAQGGEGTVVGGGNEIPGEAPPPQPPAPVAPPFGEPIQGDEPEEGRPQGGDSDQGQDSGQGEGQDQPEDQADSDDLDDSEDQDQGDDDDQGESPIELPLGLLGGTDPEDEEDPEDCD